MNPEDWLDMVMGYILDSLLNIISQIEKSSLSPTKILILARLNIKGEKLELIGDYTREYGLWVGCFSWKNK